MAFTDHISIDGKMYKTTLKTWRPEPTVPSSDRVLLDGTLDVTFGAATILSWTGEVAAPVTAAAGWGTITDLRTSLVKRQLLSFTDHYGTTYANTHIQGPFKERSLSPKWDSADNTFYVTVRIVTV